MEKQIINFINAELIAGEPIDLKPEDDLLGSGLIGSMAAFRLVGFVEERFGVKVPPEDMTIDNFETVAAISAYLRANEAKSS